MLAILHPIAANRGKTKKTTALAFAKGPAAPARPQCDPSGAGGSSEAALVYDRGFGYHPFMLIVHVHIHVKPESVDAFKAATVNNARASLLELGVLRFDVVQQADDPTRFVLVEIYRDPAAAAAHKETAHYPVWRDTVAPMMAEPRSSIKYHALI